MIPIAPITVFLLVASVLLAVTAAAPALCWIPFGIAVVLELAVPKNLVLAEDG